MNLLAFDTSTELISLAVMLKGKVVYKYSRRRKYGASSLVIYIKNALDKLNVKLNVFDAFCAGAGPGSFTGLRISFSIIKAFGAALDKPVICLLYTSDAADE